VCMLSFTLLGTWRVQGRIMDVNGVCGCYMCDSGSSMTEGGQCYDDDACPAGQQLFCPESTCGCYDAPEGDFLGQMRVMRDASCPTMAHSLFYAYSYSADRGLWCVECPDGKTVWEDHTSGSVWCGDWHGDAASVAPTDKVRATLGNVVEADSVPSSAAPQYADAIVEDCTGTDWASCEGYCRGDDASLAAAATEDATAVLNQTRLTPESILVSTAPEEAAPILTDKPASPASCWSPTYLGSDYCWHDTDNRRCAEGEAGCSCRCRKCPDGYMEDWSTGQFKCNRCLCPSSIGVCGGTSVCLPQPRGAMPWGAGRVPFDGYSALSLPALSHPPAIRALPPLPPPPFSTTYSAFFLPGGPATGVPPAPPNKAASAFPWAAPLDRRDIAPTTCADAIRFPQRRGRSWIRASQSHACRAQRANLARNLSAAKWASRAKCASSVRRLLRRA